MDNQETKTITYQGSKIELSIGALTIQPQFLGEVTVEFTEGTRTTSSLAGNVTQPSGMLETAQVTGSFILPSMDALKTLFQGAYEASATTGRVGRVRFGGKTCATIEGLPVHIHPICDKNDANDVHIYSGIVSSSLTLTYNQSDMLTAEFTIYAQPTDEGYAIVGTGDLTQDVLYDPTTDKWEPVTAEPAA